MYLTYTGENPANFVYRGHTGKIKSIYWSMDDTQLFSASSDGTVFQFFIMDNSVKSLVMS